MAAGDVAVGGGGGAAGNAVGMREMTGMREDTPTDLQHSRRSKMKNLAGTDLDNAPADARPWYPCYSTMYN